MLLTIRTLSCPPPDNPQSIHAQFGAAGGRIGRSPPCTLILPDPNRHISREHAEIRFRDNAFSIKVVSKVNSVLVNDAAIAPGEAVQLNDGDQILIGEYLMRADIAAVAASPPATLFAPPAAVAASGSNPFDVFDSLATSRVTPASAEPPPDWFRSPVAAPPPAPTSAGAGLDEFFNPTPETSKFTDVLKAHPPSGPPETFSAPAIAAPVDNRLDQFLGLHDPTAFDPDASLLGGSSDLYRASPLNMPLNSTSMPVAPPPRAPAPAAFSDHDDIFKALEHDFGVASAPPVPRAAPPAVHQLADPEPAPALPPQAAQPVVAPASPVPLQASNPIAQPAPTEGTWLRDLPLTQEPQTLQFRPPDRLPDASPAVVSSAALAAVKDGGPSQQAAAAAGNAAGEEAQRLMRVLSEALGLNPGDLDTTNPEQTLKLVGELLRMSTDGLFRMLEMRSQLKSELHIEDRTMIASRENNPLKHADTARDAIAYLVDLRQHGNKLFMPPNKAVEDTIWDICAHEMAVMAGTRAALLAALKMFSPEVIEGRIKKTGALENVLPALHKSRLWERFLGMYAELQHEAEDHFDRLLNQEFSKAYSEQSKKLKKKR